MIRITSTTRELRAFCLDFLIFTASLYQISLTCIYIFYFFAKIAFAMCDVTTMCLPRFSGQKDTVEQTRHTCTTFSTTLLSR